MLDQDEHPEECPIKFPRSTDQVSPKSSSVFRTLIKEN